MAYTQAESNAEHWYGVIGLYEKWNETLLLLATVYPKYFQGAGQLASRIQLNETEMIPIPRSVRLALETKLGDDMSLYKFARSKFEQQLQKYGI